MSRALIATNQATWQETVLWVRETPEEVEIRGDKLTLVEETMAKYFLGGSIKYIAKKLRR